MSAQGLDASFWRDRLAPYQQPSVPRAIADLATSVVPYLALTALMFALLNVSYLLALSVAIPAAGFLVRTFIVFHDCTHGSFLPSRRANVWVGTVCGLLVYTPFHVWRHEHNVHHATAGDLDKRGRGDVETLTVTEYNALSRGKRLEYRLFRNPVVMLGIGPIWALLIEPRLVPSWAKERFGRSIVLTDLALVVVIGGLCLLLGWQAVLMVLLPTAMLAGAGGIWLFYVQHQFEDVYWERNEEWSYAQAALQGSSYLKLPKVLQFFSGNIGLHHVHHLSTRVPNYNLQRTHDEIEVFHDVPTLTMADGLRCFRLKLIDEAAGKLVTFKEARAATAEAASRTVESDGGPGAPTAGRTAPAGSAA